MNSFDYFSNEIKNVEVDSMILPDTTDLLKKGVSSQESRISSANVKYYEETNIYQKLAAFFITFARMSNSNEAIISFQTEQSVFPIFTEIIGTDNSLSVVETVRNKINEALKLQDIKNFKLDNFISYLQLQQMPMIYTNKEVFNKITSDCQNKLSILVNKNSIEVKYNNTIYLQDTIERFIRIYNCVLKGVQENKIINSISLIDDKMIQELDGFLQNTVSYDSSVSVIDLLNETISKYPDRVALVYKDTKITYKELGAITDRIATFLTNKGIGNEDVVSILISRNHLMPIAAIGVLKAGAAYQPLDPSYPEERLMYMMKDAGIKLLIAEKELLSRVKDYKGEVFLTGEFNNLPEAKSTINKSKKNGLFILLYTSGSTGLPKGVCLEHRNIVAFINWYHRYYKLNENSKVAAYASFGFDAHMMDLYPALTAGGEVHIIEEGIRLELLKLKGYFEKNGITHSFMTTQVGRQYAQLFNDAKNPYYLSVGGETLVPIEPPKNYEFINGYGPTECTIFTTTYKVDRLYQNIPIGKALDNLHLYVVDSNLNRLPVGVPGELCVAGPQVGRGYLNLKEQTEKTFVKNSFDNTVGYERMYRTGDIVRFLSDGNIEFIGRKDSQVKIRGFRIELSEVEHVIREYKAIKDATVVAFDETGGGKYIAAYIVSDEKIDIDQLNAFIAERKPAYMVPAVTMQIDAIPLNQNQKVNKRALPKPDRKVSQKVLPETERQRKIYDILKNILSHDEFGITTPFTEAGLTSVASIRFIVELTETFGVAVSTQNLSEFNTIKSLDSYLANAETITDVREVREKYPLTQTQMGIYVECLRNPESVQYNLPGAFALSPDTNVNELKSAINAVIKAHPAIKCIIHEDESGNINMIPEPSKEISIDVVDGSEDAWGEFFASYARPFDMRNELLFRFTFYKTSEHLYLVMDFHHIIFDGSSIAVFAEELNRYLKKEELLGENFSQYDISVNEEIKRISQEYKKAKAFYDGIYKDNFTEFSLEGDLHLEKEKCGFFKILDSQLDKKQVEEFCKKHRITENVFFISVMGYVMGQYNHTEDSVFTTIYNGRKDSRVMNTFGMLVKTLPVYCTFSNELKVSEYMLKNQSLILDSMKHDIYSFAEISNAYHIIPEIMFVYQGDSFTEFEIGNQKTIFREAVPDKAKAAISINIFVEKGKYRFEFEYRSHRYSESYINNLYDIFVTAANSFLKANTISDISILSEKQEAKINAFNDTDYDVEIKPVNKLIEAWVEKIPDEIAVIANGEKLTYRELNEMSNKVANGLLKRGLPLDTLVGLILNREKNVYIVREGILKAGGGFLPLVTEYPDDRIDYCLRDGKCPFVITTKAIKEERQSLFANKPYSVLTVEDLLADTETSSENPNLDIPLSNIAYCLYTSGSTGKPKGVLIEHKTLCNFVNSNKHNIEVENYTKNGKTSLAFAAITFDVSVMEEFIPLTNGMTICMANEDEIHNPLQLSKLLLDNHVDIMKCTPSFMMSIVEIPEMKEALSNIKAFDIGAEAFPPVLYDKMRAVNPNADIINSYGPTECTVSCTSKLLTTSSDTNIGGPLTNMKLYVVNSSKHSLPVGISGELIICGAGVGRGYMNLPEKTKEAFFTYKGMPAYHSGDLVKWNEAGEIIYLGRIDNQVKLHGLRIELEEVENAIGSFEGIKSCKVVVKKNGNDEYLAAYYTGVTDIDKKALVAHISGRLAHYMVPGAYMQLDEMPLTNHGKIDKKRLPEIAVETAERKYIEPETPLEKELCDKYAEILNVEKVSVTDSFFEIGGTSLSATKVVMFCNTHGYKIVYKDIFSNPSPRLLAGLIEQKSSSVANDKSNLTSNADKYDFSEINDVLSCNVLKSDSKINRKKQRSILLTGATGFLGIHILHELLAEGFENIICLMRKGKLATCEARLSMLYVYYFDDDFSKEDLNRIRCINGDITDENLSELLKNVNFDVILNCAACVKHFVKDDLLERINVKGVENLIKLALSRNAEFVQVSTTSVAGEGNEDTIPASKLMKENELYFGQILENEYIRTKFLAERAVLTAIKKDGLKAKIMRCGNLMSRKSDGEFQINFVTNGFMRSLRAYKALGQFPMSAMHNLAEFSPIDSTAQAIVTLMQCDETYNVFHTFNSHRLYMSDIIYSMKDYGFNIDIVTDKVFSETLKNSEKDEKLTDAVLGLIAYQSSDGKPRYEIMADNKFTSEVLYRMDFKWPITDDEYLRKSIEALYGLNFFD